MLQSLRTTTLASAIGLSLLAGGFSVSAAAVGTALSVTSQVGVAEPYIVTFVEDGLMHYGGGVQGIAATRAPTSQPRKVDVRTQAAVAYRGYLQTQRNAHVAAIDASLGRQLQIEHSYAITENGISASMTAAEAAAIAAVPGVKSVKRAGTYSLATFRGPKFIGADKIWDGSATPSSTGTQGQGVVVGVLDTGSYAAHPSFSDDVFNAQCSTGAGGPDDIFKDGFDGGATTGGHKLLSTADCTTSSGGLCTGSDPEAAPGNGHGVHTASTAAGNTIDNTVDPAPALPDGVTMSGVAPCANLRTYKVCATTNCAGDAIVAGIENAIVDQVDVINFSISGGTDPWAEDSDLHFLDATEADIFVAASAGNTSATVTNPVGQVNHIGPWVTSVAASSQDEVLSPVLQVTGPGTPPDAISAIPLTPSDTTPSTDPLSGTHLKTYPANIAGCTDGGGIPAGTFTGAIAVLRRGPTNPGGTACSFSEKSINAANAGAIAVVIANNVVGVISATTPGATVPTYTIDKTSGDALIDFVGANEDDAVGDVVPSAIGNVQGDVLADFSFRGPTPSPYADLTKPDISGPGVNIYAALTADEGNYGLLSGTSMSSPHLAGSGALIRAVHPDWTPIEIKSALMTTAVTGFEEDGTTPWTIDDVGSGRVNLTQAALVGLTLDETGANFTAANPDVGTVALKDLNLPSMRNSACDPAGCTWTRTVKSQLSDTASYTASYESATDDGATVTVDPATFSIEPGQTQELTFTATPGTATGLQFGNVTLHEANGLGPDQHLTVAVEAAGPPPPTTLCNAGECVLKVDTYTGSGSLSAIGVDVDTYFLWLNRFTPDPTDYPFTLTNVQTVFVGPLNGGTVGSVVGDTFDVYVYQDDDNDPSNGAALVASMLGVAVTAPLGSVQTITLPDSGVLLSGPGDVLIAIDYHGPGGHSPATADAGPDAGRSWISNVFHAGADSADTDLSQDDLMLTPALVAGFSGNWILRGNGTKDGGRPVSFGKLPK